MKGVMNLAVDGARRVFKSSVLAAAIYVSAVVAVFTITYGDED